MENLGKIIYKIRTNKGLKQVDLSDTFLSPSHISQVEKGKKMLGGDKLLKILVKTNTTFEEFTHLLGDEHIQNKISLEHRLSEYCKRQNLKGLKSLVKEADTLYLKFNDFFFDHIRLMSLAMIELLENDYDYEKAKKYLDPIKNYLKEVSDIGEWGIYELSLISNCLFMFEIDTAIAFGENALKIFRKNYSQYKNQKLCCVLLSNLATYALDYEKYYHLALQYSLENISLSSTQNDASNAISSKIAYQLACFKMGNGLFDKTTLIKLIETYKILEWHEKHRRILLFVKKHGIVL